MKKIISFPRLGNYHIPLSCFLHQITKKQVIVPPKITLKTKNIGAKYSPDFVCAPFKYNLGNYIEALNEGATVILQAGGGCRYGYYAELQEQILKDLGYNFEFENFIKNNHISICKVYNFVKRTNPKINIIKFIYHFIILSIKILTMDKIENYVRLNKALIIDKKTLNNIEINYYKNLNTTKFIISTLIFNKKVYYKIKKLPKNNNSNNIKIALVGELYTLMESEANNQIEQFLINKGAIIYRNTNLTYLMLTKKLKQKKLLKQAKEYITYQLGADGAESIVISKLSALSNYDGIIHVKSFGCTPEINAMPILNKVSKDYNIPIMYLTFDMNTSDTGLITRLEAFYDMLEAKRNTKN